MHTTHDMLAIITPRLVWGLENGNCAPILANNKQQNSFTTKMNCTVHVLNLNWSSRLYKLATECGIRVLYKPQNEDIADFLVSVAEKNCSMNSCSGFEHIYSNQSWSA